MIQSEHTPHPFPVVGIGGSAGGLRAFQTLFDLLAPDLGAAYVVVQHLMSDQPSQLPEILARHTDMPVLEITDGMEVEADHVYVAPPGPDVVMKDDCLHLVEPDETRTSPASIDHFFRSLADALGSTAIAVVFSGMGGDGTLGLKAVKAADGMVLVQNPESAVFDAMPRSAVATHMADRVLDIENIAQALKRFITGRDGEAQTFDDQQLEPVFGLLRRNHRHDFRGYKRPMLSRRIARRMNLADSDNLDHYLELLGSKPDELERLRRDLLISVTDFFRDPESFDALRDEAIPNLPALEAADSPLRVWVPACATGEEAYSVATLLSEVARLRDHEPGFQVFASDIDEQALEIARLGIYPENAAGDIPPDLLQRYFAKTDHHYQVSDELRQRIVIANQNLLHDPPYSRLDLICCRNLLIYLSPEAQNYVLGLFHFALRDGGYLFLGNAETIGSAQDLFKPVDQRHRIYQRIAGVVRDQRHMAFSQTIAQNAANKPVKKAESESLPAANADQITQQLLLREYVPASVLINRKAEVLCAYGQIQDYLALPTGATRLDLVDMVTDDLRNKVRALTRQAIRENLRHEVTAYRDAGEADRRLVTISARPLSRPVSARGLLLVTFQESPAAPATGDSYERDDASENRLAEELQNLQEEYQQAVYSLEGANEDLQGSNEEIMSMNEELQSTNEELETSKEELQSLNEELSTVNNELRSKVGELERLNIDLDNLFSGTRIATLFLDRQLCIMRFTPAIKEQLNLLSSDIGRPIQDIKLKFDDANLLNDAADVLKQLSPREREVQGEKQRWYRRRIVPYRTRDDRIDGVVVTFNEITELRSAMVLAQSREEQLRLLADTLPALISYVDRDLKFQFVNAAYTEWFGRPQDQLIGSHLQEVMGTDKYDFMLTHCETALAGKRVAYDDSYQHQRLGKRRMHVTHVPYLATSGEQDGFYLLATDVTELKTQEENLLARQAEAAHANRVASMSELAATIAHQLNQPLQSITSYVGALKRQLQDSGQESAREIAEKLTNQARSASEILNELREFIGRRTFDQEVIDMNAIIRRVLTLTEARTAHTGAQVRLQLEAGLPTIYGSPIQFEQMLVNLVVNALEAMEKSDRRVLSVTTSMDEDTVEISVRDTGPGIALDQINRIFEAFYTRKDDGMGMGLAISRGIAEEYGGKLWVESEEGDGALFRVRLPLDGDA